MSNAETLDYLKGNVIKYVYRYGKKHGNNKVDLLKAIHFIIMMDAYADKKIVDNEVPMKNKTKRTKKVD
jgi:hypothetical protein